MACYPACLFPLHRESFVLYLKVIYLPDYLPLWKIRLRMFRLACLVNRSMFLKELNKDCLLPGHSWRRVSPRNLVSVVPKHPSGQPAAGSISPPFLSDSTICCLCSSSLSSAGISGAGEGISKSYAACWGCHWTRVSVCSASFQHPEEFAGAKLCSCVEASDGFGGHLCLWKACLYSVLMILWPLRLKGGDI